MFELIFPQFTMTVHVFLSTASDSDFNEICSDAPASESRGSKIYYDLLVICLLHLSASLPTSSVEFSFVRCNKNLCNSKSSLPPDTSPSFSPLSLVFRRLSGSLLLNHLSTPTLGCYNILTFLCCFLHQNIKTTRFRNI